MHIMRSHTNGEDSESMLFDALLFRKKIYFFSGEFFPKFTRNIEKTAYSDHSLTSFCLFRQLSTFLLGSVARSLEHASLSA